MNSPGWHVGTSSTSARGPVPPALLPLERLAASRSSMAFEEIDWSTPIDRSRWFFCETLTPLYYTSMYGALSPDQQRRYNQLTAMLANEVIAIFETELLDAALNAVESSKGDDALLAAVVRFRDDERRHAESWARLNRLSEPAWYQGRPRNLVEFPAPASLCSRLIARRPLLFPVVFWIQLVQEERSIDLSRRCVRVPADRMEPRYAAVHAAHIQDEVRHVQVDRHLIERFYAARSMMLRRVTARLLRTIVAALLLRPVRSAAGVVRQLAHEYPELTPLVPRMVAELRRLDSSDGYHEMMYSRQTTPITFSLFDRFPEFHQMQHVLRAYRPRPNGVAS